MLQGYKHNRWIAVLLISLLIIAGDLHFYSFSNEPAYATTSTGEQFLAFTSDVHNMTNNTSADRLGAWIDKMEEKFGYLDYMGFCGDMANATNTTQNQFWSLTETAMSEVAQRSVPVCYTTGNHEYDPGNFSPNLNSTTSKYTVNSTPANVPGDAKFRIYCLGAASSTSEYTTAQIEALSGYLDSVGNSKPIIILTHYPLHYYNRRSTNNASAVIDALNAAVTNNTPDDTSDDKTIIFLWGHNHTESDTNYDEIFSPGRSIKYDYYSSKTLDFYYATAGCMSDSEYSTGSNSVKGKGLIIQIKSNGKLGFGYFDENGFDRTEGGSTIAVDQHNVAVEGVTLNKTSLELTAGDTDDTLKVKFTPPNASNRDVTWSSSNSGIASVDQSGIVTAVSAGNATITVKSDADASKKAECAVKVNPVVTTEYILADTLEAGNEYLIANGNSGSVSILSTESGGSRKLKGVSATVTNGIITITSNTRAKTAFTCEADGSENNTYFKNGNQYLYADNSSGLRMNSSYSGRYWHYKAMDGDKEKYLLWLFSGTSGSYGYTDTSSNYKYYLSFSNGNFTDSHVSTTSLSNTSTPKMYLFAKFDSATHEHNYGTEIAQVEPTCTSDGIKAHYKCSGCYKLFVKNGNDYVETTAEALKIPGGHKYGEEIAQVAATCTADGMKAHYECSGCHKLFVKSGNNYIETSEAALRIQGGHNYGSEIAQVAATCTTDGTKAYYECSECHKLFVKNGNNYIETSEADLKIPAGHDYGTEIAQISATCTKDGVRAHYECSGCHKLFVKNGNSYVETTEADLKIPGGHTYGSEIARVEPTCTADGMKAHYECSVCHKLFEKNSSDFVETSEAALRIAGGHNYGTQVPRVEATCTTDGIEAYYECSECHKLFVKNGNNYFEVTEDDLIIPGGHKYGQQIARVEATCTADGMEAYYECSVCHKLFVKDGNDYFEVTEDDLVLPAGHKYGSELARVKATCTADGVKAHYECSGCHKLFIKNGNEYTETTADALKEEMLGHDWDYEHISWSWAEDHSTAKAVLTCRNDWKHKEEISAEVTNEQSGDMITYTAVFTAPDGNEYSNIQTVDISHVHTLSHHEAISPTCTEDGSIEYWTCSGCEKFFSDAAGVNEIEGKDTVAARFGHDWDYEHISWSWAEDYSTAKAALICKIDGSHKEEVSATVTSEQSGDVITYTAVFTGTDGEEYRDSKTVVLPHVHTLTHHAAAAPTCTEDGSIEYWTCSGCEKFFSDEAALIEIEESSTVIQKLGHDWNHEHISWNWADDYSTAKAVLTCTNDNVHINEIAAEVTIEQSDDLITYTAVITGLDGKEYKDVKTVDISHKHVLAHHEKTEPGCTTAGGSEYWSCEGCGGYFSDELAGHEIEKDSWIIPASGHSFGTESLTRKATSKRSGILSKVCSACGEEYDAAIIQPVIAKAKVNSKTKATVSWRKVNGAQRYRVYIKKCSSKKYSFVRNTKKTKYVKKSLKKGTSYSFKVLAQRKIDGKWVTISTGYAGHFVSGNLSKNKKYTNPKSISVASREVTLDAGVTAKIRPSVRPARKGKKILAKGHAPKYRYLSDNTDIASVDSKGNITAKAPGTCNIYVIAVNGVSKGIKVTVR